MSEPHPDDLDLSLDEARALLDRAEPAEIVAPHIAFSFTPTTGTTGFVPVQGTVATEVPATDRIVVRVDP
ncbi:hypothetical protein BH24ACT7_BH24ACT7_08690 [soil metagenome]